MKTFLEKLDQHVLLAADGIEAMQIARKNKADLVITDINMAGMSGINLTHKLTRLDDYKHVPILMITTETDQYKKNKARDVGANDWIAKPVSERRLIHAVNKVLGH